MPLDRPCVVLSSCGAALGLALATAGTFVVSRLQAFSIPLLESVRVDAPTLAFTTFMAVLVGLLFGLVPALQVETLAIQDTLKDSGRGSSQGARQTWIRGALVVSEVAFACVLLVGSGLLLRSFLRVLDVDLGFRPERVAEVRIDPSARYTNQEQRNAYYDEALRRVRSVSGMEGAGLTDVLPFSVNRSWGVFAVGQVYEKDSDPNAFVRIVSDGYLRAMGIPLVAGRDFTSSDTASSEGVVLINETLARRLWPGQDPIGQRVTQDGGRRVIGVVGDVRLFGVTANDPVTFAGMILCLTFVAGLAGYLPARRASRIDPLSAIRAS